MMIDQRRVRVLKDGPFGGGAVVYWMSRDQRVRDNWALLYAQELALAHKRPLVVVFCLVPGFLGATLRQYGFMIRGLKEVESRLAQKAIPFVLLTGSPEKKVPAWVEVVKAAAVVTDFDPLRIKRAWKQKAAKGLRVPLYEVDAHNIVPCRLASIKQEYGAYTLRPKIKRLFDEYLTDFPKLKIHPYPFRPAPRGPGWPKIMHGLKVDRTVGEVDGIAPGEEAAAKHLDRFLKSRLKSYAGERNDPVLDGQSGLSPYLHFGQLSAQRAALKAVRQSGPGGSKEDFLEELIVRRELADNFCFYNPDYDNPGCLPSWAAKTLNEHRRDKREFVYSLDQFEQALTHDELWNAAQRQMMITGKMHGYMRMYWAKKILEWTPSLEQAFETAIALNDKYELDGRDPNGYAGIAWSLGGVHDRAWGERPVFGKVRYMSDQGCKSKFDVKEYIRRWSGDKE